ncbi:MAG: hypothetical protein ACRC33_02610 [Gemmataceae bacterium]
MPSSAPSPFVIGRIVYAVVNDPQGRNPKERPCLIVNRDPEDTPDARLAVVAITSTFAEIEPADRVMILYPQAQLNGRPHPITGLTCESAAACRWQTLIRESEVTGVGGRVPGHLLDRVLTRVNELVEERRARQADADRKAAEPPASHPP